MTEYNLSGERFRSAYTRVGIKVGRETPATLDEAGETLLASTKSAIAKYDPDGTALKFAFITDLHRSEDGIYTTNEIDDRYSLRLLSRICDEVDLDAVFCGGDITNGRDENADYVQKNMQDVVADFDDLFPYTNVFGTIGNHDKRYSVARPLVTNEWLNNLWDDIQMYGSGVELHYIDDTNYYIDFTKHHIRMIFINQYDDVDSNSSWYANEGIASDTGIHTHGTTAWKAGLPTTDKADWIVGVIVHGADTTIPYTNPPKTWSFTDLSDTLEAYVNNGGKGVLGVFAGHGHVTQSLSLSAFAPTYPGIPIIRVINAFATSEQVGTANAYGFSVYIVNSETGVFHEIRVGRNALEIPYCAWFGNVANNGLLHNGTASPDRGYTKYYCVYNGNYVLFDSGWKSSGYNLTNLSKEWGYAANDMVTGDTENVLFSAVAGDVIKTEIKFSADSDDSETSTQTTFKVFSPQIANMLVCTVTAGATFTNEITLSEDKDVTALGVFYSSGYGSGYSLHMGFELNVYKNGVRLVRS